MSGGLSTSRFQEDSRFYTTPPRRHQLLQQQQQQQQQQLLLLQQQQKQQQEQLERKMNLKKAQTELENRSGSGDSTSSKPSVSSEYTLTQTNLTNLDSFLESTTPSVPAQRLAKSMGRPGWRNGEVDFHPYFVLGDLWEFFKEWSAYGAGVPLVLNESGDSVVQYYVPYLSAIQLYVNPSKPSSRLRQPGDDSDVESSRETSSNGSRISDTDSSKNPPDSSSSEDGDVYPPGLLKFQYLERDSPYTREPLANKISDLASRFPELETYKSCDLLSSSWMSVAWYPIYRIPMGPTLQDLDACFLTFHTLSTPLSSTGGSIDGSAKLPLPIFGLASHKLKGSVWATHGQYERQRTSSLLQAAERWLSDVQVDHPDYRFFVSRNSFER